MWFWDSILLLKKVRLFWEPKCLRTFMNFYVYFENESYIYALFESFWLVENQSEYMIFLGFLRDLKWHLSIIFLLFQVLKYYFETFYVGFESFILILSSLLYILSGLIMLWSPNVLVFCKARLLDWFGIGLVVTLVPVYISKTATLEIRVFRQKRFFRDFVA